MKLAEFSVKNFQFTVVVFVMLIGLGLTSLVSIPRSEDPVFPIPSFAVVAVLPELGDEDARPAPFLRLERLDVAFQRLPVLIAAKRRAVDA